MSFGSQGTSLKFIEKSLSSLTAPVLDVLKSGFDSARSHPNVSILLSLIVATGGYFLARRYGKAKEASNLNDINNSLSGINRKLTTHGATLTRHSEALATLAGNVLTLNEPILSSKTSMLGLERSLGENHAALLSQFRTQNNNINAIGTTLGAVKTNVEFVVAEQRARALTK
jgi:hypothetical protein